MTLLWCPVCFGDPSSPMTQSAKWGVLFLLAVVVTVLAGIASVAIVWSRRARALAQAEAGAGQSAPSSVLRFTRSADGLEARKVFFRAFASSALRVKRLFS